MQKKRIPICEFKSTVDEVTYRLFVVRKYFRSQILK